MPELNQQPRLVHSRGLSLSIAQSSPKVAQRPICKGQPGHFSNYEKRQVGLHRRGPLIKHKTTAYTCEFLLIRILAVISVEKQRMHSCKLLIRHGCGGVVRSPSCKAAHMLPVLAGIHAHWDLVVPAEMAKDHVR